MANKANHFSTQTTASSGDTPSQGGDKPKKDELWSSMLNSVASGRRLPEKNLLVLGGSVDSQREFLESLSAGEGRSGRSGALDAVNGVGINGGGGHATRAPVANHFALGYTYYDVLDTDAEDTLARISMYTLTSAAPAFGTLLAPLLTPAAIPHTLIVVLLDWAEPWRWMRQLRRWVLLLRTVLVSLPDEAKETMEEVMLSWRDRGRGGGTNLDGTSAATATTATGALSEMDVALPPGPGEWEDALGLPLCVVCQNAEKMEILEKTQGWKEEEFDTVLQFMRTVLLRHGASLIYTTPSAPSQLPTLVHSSLGIHSLLKKQPLKHNVIDRDKILVPPNWDSWGKIRVLRDGFDADTVSKGWSIDIDQPYPLPLRVNGADANGVDTNENERTVVNGGGGSGGSVDVSTEKATCVDPEGSTVALYEDAVQDPSMDALQQMAGHGAHSTKLEVETTETQTFLAQQLELLEKYRQKGEEAARKAGGGGDAQSQAAGAAGRFGASTRSNRSDEEFLVGESKVNEHIGPVQFNMGGIQVDADDMMKRLKNRQGHSSSPEPDGQEAEQGAEEAPQMNSENLQAFFAGLMNRKQK